MEGIDVSQWQGDIDWEKVAAAVGFAFVRVMYGSGYMDARFTAGRVEALQKSLPHRHGFYCFGRPDIDDPGDEARKFIQRVKQQGGKPQPKGIQLGGHEYPNCALDYEVRRADGRDQWWADEWSKAFVAEEGFEPGLYSGYVMRERLSSVDHFAYVWDAAYTSAPLFAPFVPKAKRIFWQYSEHGQCAGIVGNVDRDRYLG